MRFSTQLPFFTGFYETDYENSDTAYYAIKEELDYYRNELSDEHPEYKHLAEGDLEFDYKEYRKDIMDAFIDSFAYRAPEFVENVEFDCLSSPKYYNFRNDELYAYVTLADDWQEKMKAFMAENHDWLKKRIADDWTSYDGFTSFMENNIDDWEYFLFESPDERYIGIMIGYMMFRANKNIYDDLLMDTLENVYAGSYVYILPEAEERLKDMIENGEIVLPDPNQLEIPFPTE